MHLPEVCYDHSGNKTAYSYLYSWYNFFFPYLKAGEYKICNIFMKNYVLTKKTKNSKIKCTIRSLSLLSAYKVGFKSLKWKPNFWP